MNLLLFTGLSGSVVALVFLFFAIYGPFLVWVISRNNERWDTAHPTG